MKKEWLNKLLLQFFVFLLSILAYFIYRDYASIRYDYLGYVFYEIPFLYLIIMSFLVSLLVFMLPMRINLPSDIMAVVIYLFLIVPSFTVPLYVTSYIDYEQYIIFLLIEVFVFYMLSRLSSLKIYSEKNIFGEMRLKRPNFFIAVFAVIGFLVIVNKYGFNIQILTTITDVSELYTLRANFREENIGGAGFAGYALPWLARVVIPCLFAILIYQKKYIFSLFLIFFQLVLFSASGHKSIFAAIIVVPFIFFILRFKNSTILFSQGICVFFLMSIITYYAIDGTFLIEVFFRRMFLVLGMLDGYYLEYYTPDRRLGYDFINNLLGESPTIIRAAFEIGENYFGRSELSANVGLFAAGYSSYGLLSVLFESILFLIFLFFLNWAAYYKNRKIAICVFIMPCMGLIDSQLFTVIVTHGLLLAFFIIIFIVPSQNYVKV